MFLATWHTRHLSRRGKRGQSLLEFALILPIMLLITYGIIEFGRAMFVYTAANTAVHEASRYAAAVGNNAEGVPYYQDCKGIRAIAQHFAFFADVKNIEIKYDRGNPDSTFAQCPSSVDRSNVSLEAGDRVHVILTVAYKPLFLFNTDRVDFTFDSAHTVVKEVVVEGGSGGGGGGTGSGNNTPSPQNSPTATPTTPSPAPTNTPVPPTPTPTKPTNTPIPSPTPITPTPAPTSTPVIRCNVQYSRGTPVHHYPLWGSSYYSNTATITIQWTAEQGLNDWQLVWVYPNDQDITSSYDDDWEVYLDQNGQSATAEPVTGSDDPRIAPNGERSFSFDYEYSNQDDQPTNFTLSGTLDDGTETSTSCTVNEPAP